MVYRNKVFVSFDGDSDIHYYRLMRAWRQNDNTPFNFYDAHDLNTALDTSAEETIKRRLRERLGNAKVVVSLIGEKTRYLYRFVRWELEQATIHDIPIIGCNLNGKRRMDPDRCPPIIRDRLAVHVSFNVRILQHALETWPEEYRKQTLQGASGARFYSDAVYQRLSL